MARLLAELDPKLVYPEDEDLDRFEVQGVVGSSVDKGRVWINFWRRHTGITREVKCSLLGCGSPATLGGHMHVKYKKRHFILPICSRCNSDSFGYDPREGWFDTKKDIPAVSIRPHPGSFVP